MRKTLTTLAAALSAMALLAACGGDDSEDAAPAAQQTPAAASPVTLKIGASPVPHADILRFVQDNLAKDAGLNLDVVEYTDYIQPNVALSEGDLDGNYFQHLPYLESQEESQGYDFDHFEGVHIEPYAAYSKKIKDVAELPQKGKIGITNDPSNQARALDLLVKAGVITLKDTGDKDPTIFDIESNTKDLEFVETDPEQLPRTLDDFDLAIINGNYALEAGLNPAEDSLLIESGEGNPYSNFLAVRTEDKASPALVKLDELLHSPQVKEFIETKWPSGEVLPAF
ncbi:MetQ/NlpA family ABC transporter substrate-binding protein [Motilibacter deserti]|uniref:Lipoprotein n=1 Tax=Motilibacter deserti TaxID=2714956 RepID=A0ABX0H1E5_9ACTN|nr:MetQ/NlpA family ABC transporter substrate-binding protein [Motilibacter deserti]NHC15780.1 ABC transporter substrate-binding protein [Motilibacter deserti]